MSRSVLGHQAFDDDVPGAQQLANLFGSRGGERVDPQRRASEGIDARLGEFDVRVECRHGLGLQVSGRSRAGQSPQHDHQWQQRRDARGVVEHDDLVSIPLMA